MTNLSIKFTYENAYTNRGPGARRRRRRKTEKDDQKQDIFLLQNIEHLSSSKQTNSRIHQRRTSSYDYPFDRILHHQESVIDNSTINYRKSSSEGSTVITNVDDERIISSTVSVQRVKRTSLAKNDTIRDVNETQDDGDANESIPDSRRRRVSVTRVNRMYDTMKTDDNNLNVASQVLMRSISAIPTKNVQVNVIQVPKNQRITKQRARALSAGNISVSGLDRSSMEMRTLAKRGNGVTVTKIPRK